VQGTKRKIEPLPWEVGAATAMLMRKRSKLLNVNTDMFVGTMEPRSDGLPREEEDMESHPRAPVIIALNNQCL
jgi:hypothetical protein